MKRKMLLYGILLLLSGVVWSAIGFDTSAQNVGTSSANPVTLSYTAGSEAKILVLCIGNSSTTQRTGGSPTFNGVEMIQVGTQQSGAFEGTAEMWYLPYPDTGSAYTISVPNSNTRTLGLIASSYTTSALGIALDVYTQSGTTAANPSLTLEPTVDGNVVIDSFTDGNANRPSAWNQTLLYRNDNGSWSNNAQYALQDTKGPITFSWTIASDDVGRILASFKETFGSLVQGGSFISGDSVIFGQ